MERFNPISNSDYQELRWTLDFIAYQIGNRLSCNPTYDERGLTDELLYLLVTYFKTVKLGKFSIDLYASKPSEKKTGADILFRIKTNRREISFDRYVLIQAKKFLRKSERFSETEPGNTHLSGQITKMHTYNPEFSYLLLYSTHDLPLGNVVVQTFNYYLKVIFLLKALFVKLVTPEEFDNLAITEPKPQAKENIEGNYPVTLLRSKTWQMLRNNNPENLLSYSETLPNFLLDDLVSGKIGKEWDNTIEKAQGDFSIVVTLSVTTRQQG